MSVAAPPPPPSGFMASLSRLFWDGVNSAADNRLTNSAIGRRVIGTGHWLLENATGTPVRPDPRSSTRRFVDDYVAGPVGDLMRDQVLDPARALVMGRSTEDISSLKTLLVKWSRSEATRQEVRLVRRYLAAVDDTRLAALSRGLNCALPQDQLAHFCRELRAHCGNILRLDRTQTSFPPLMSIDRTIRQPLRQTIRTFDQMVVHNQGLLDQATARMRTELANGVATAQDAVLRQPNFQLVEARQSVRGLLAACTNVATLPPHDVRSLGQTLHDQLSAVHTNAPQLFRNESSAAAISRQMVFGHLLIQLAHYIRQDNLSAVPADFLAHLRTANNLLSERIREEQGVVARATDLVQEQLLNPVVQKVDAIVTRLENLPRTMWQNAVGGGSAPSHPSSGGTTAAGSAGAATGTGAAAAPPPPQPSFPVADIDAVLAQFDRNEQRALENFRRLPDHVKNAAYEQLYKLVSPQGADNYMGVGEHLFLNEHGRQTENRLKFRALRIAKGQLQEAAAAPSASGTLGGIAASMMRFIKDTFIDGSNALTKATAPVFAGFFLKALHSAKTLVSSDARFAETLGIINGLIVQVENVKDAPQDGAPWKTLYEAISSSLSTLNRQPIYINGFLVPSFGAPSQPKVDAVNKLSENTKLIDNPLPQVPAKKEDKVRILEQQKKELIKNAARLTALKYIYESTLGEKVTNNNFYFDMMQEPNDQVMRQKFFKKIDETKSNWFLKTWAKFKFYFATFVFPFFIDGFSNNMLIEIQEYIRTQGKNDFQDTGNQTINRFTSYLSILSGAYRRVGNNANVTGDIIPMIKEELDKATSNQGYTSADLYNAVAKTAVNVFAPKIDLTGRITLFLQDIKSNWLKVPCAILSIPAYIIGGCAQFIGNLLIGVILKSPLQTAIQSLVGTSVDSLKENNINYTINCFLEERLGKVLEKLRDANDKNESLDDQKTRLKKTELSAFVKNLLEVLPKTKRDLTVEGLRKLVNDKSHMDRLKEFVDGMFIDDAIETAGRLIAISLDAILNQEELEDQISRSMALLNNCFAPGAKPYTSEDVLSKEESVRRLTDQILDLAITNAVEAKLDFTNEKQKAASDKFVEQLNTDMNNFIKRMNEHKWLLAEQLGQKDYVKAHASMQNLLDEYRHFHNKRIITQGGGKIPGDKDQQIGVIGNAALHADTKERLNKLIFDLGEVMKPLGVQLKALLEVDKPVLNNHNLIEKLRIIQDCFKTLHEKIADEKLCDLQIGILRIKLDELPKGDHEVERLQELLREKLNEIQRIRAEYLEAQVTHDLVSRRLGTEESSSSYMHRLIEEKKAAIARGAPAEELPAHVKVHQVLQKIPNVQSRTTLTEKANAIIYANDMRELNRAIPAFEREVRTVLESESIRMQEFTDLTQEVHEELRRKTDDLIARNARGISDNAVRIRDALAAATQEIEKIQRWSGEHVKPIAFISMQAIDMKALKEGAKQYAYRSVKDRVDGLIGFAIDEVTLQYGIFNHSAFLPFVKYYANRNEGVASKVKRVLF